MQVHIPDLFWSVCLLTTIIINNETRCLRKQTYVVQIQMQQGIKLQIQQLDYLIRRSRLIPLVCSGVGSTTCPGTIRLTSILGFNCFLRFSRLLLKGFGLDCNWLKGIKSAVARPMPTLLTLRKQLIFRLICAAIPAANRNTAFK